MLGIGVRIGPVIQSKITCMKVLASRIFAVAMILENESYTPQTQNGSHRRYYPHLLDSQRLDFLTPLRAASRRYGSGWRPHLVALPSMRKLIQPDSLGAQRTGEVLVWLWNEYWGTWLCCLCGVL